MDIEVPCSCPYHQHLDSTYSGISTHMSLEWAKDGLNSHEVSKKRFLRNKLTDTKIKMGLVDD